MTTEDFIGNSYAYEFNISPQGLHAGRNYGAIIFETPYESITYPIQIQEHSKKDEEQRETNFLLAQIIKQYLVCRRNNEDLIIWGPKAISALDTLRKGGRNDACFRLMQAHIYFLLGKQEEGTWILENYIYNRMHSSKNPVLSAYYLFLTTMHHQSHSHNSRVVDELQKLYVRNPHSWEILCMLINIAPEYKNLENRLPVLERQFYNGAHQIVFYLQCLDCYNANPASLKRLGSFEIQVLNFAVKYKLLTEKLSLYIANLAGQQKQFNRKLYLILGKAYQRYKDPMILTAICTLLIKGNQCDSEYFQWFQKAVKEKLKIVQLYEYYMIALDENKMRGELPQSVYLYFMHGNVLNYKKAAFLYANIVTYKEFDADLYTNYREKIVRFTWEQLEKRHINESLKILYKKYCVEEDMTAKRIQALFDICHTYEVKTSVPNMWYVMVIEKNGEIHQRVACSDGVAQVCLYDKEPRIIWETKEGRHYTDSIFYETRRLFYEPRLIEMCKRHMHMNFDETDNGTQEELNFENLKKFGMSFFDEKSVFAMCSRKIRDDNYEEEGFLIHICYELFHKGEYDKVTLTYLANYFCGATFKMKEIWYATQEYNVKNHKLAERIITQMVFAECMFRDEEIFAHYYMKGAYFRLKQAYLAYVSKDFVIYGRQLDPCIFTIILKEIKDKETLADICKIAILKYYATREIDSEVKDIVKQFLKELCEKQLVFPFYLQYPEPWLREVYLYDKHMIEYRAKSNGKVELEYQIYQNEKEILEYHKEILNPMYGNIYVKSFVIYGDENLKYSFRELDDSRNTITTVSNHIFYADEHIPFVGIYGKINKIIELPPVKQTEALQEFEKELKLSREIFTVY